MDVECKYFICNDMGFVDIYMYIKHVCAVTTELTLKCSLPPFGSLMNSFKLFRYGESNVLN